jgi:CRISPR-associated protein Cas1
MSQEPPASRDASADLRTDANESLDLVPARMLNEFTYCPRLFHLEFVQGEFAENEDTLIGTSVHRRVEDESGRLPPSEELGPEDRVAARAVLLSAPRLGLIARIDLLEGEDGSVRPVDYKKGSPGQHGPWEPERVQLCAQGLILRENGYRCREGVLYYAQTKQRVVVTFDEPLERRTLEQAARLRLVARQPTPPPPLVDSPKCPRCSLVGICLPDEVNLLRGARLGEIRRTVPARDDRGPLYVVEQGATIGKGGGRLIVRRRDGTEEAVRALDVSRVSVFGNVQVSAQAVRALAEEEIPIFHHTYGGWLIATTSGAPNRNVELRARQYRLADDAEASLQIAIRMVVGKIRNQRTLLRRNGRLDVRDAVTELRRLARLAQSSRSAERLLGIEGMAARVYFASFGLLLRDRLGFDFEGRRRRPAPDPVNAMLGFLYALLVRDCVAALIAVGLDPYRGLYHQLRYGRPSLALDLAEEARPLIADSTVLSLVNSGVIRASDFVRRGPACALTDSGRRRVIAAYEDRVDCLVTHPVFGYAISYRRVLEVQARLLARAINGEIPAYRPFTTR